MSKVWCGFAALAMLLGAGSAGIARAQQEQEAGRQGGRGGAQNAAGANAASPDKEEMSVTEHTIHLGSQTIPYKATASTTMLKNDAGDPTGLIYSVAYTRSDVKDPSTRPISFLYNGGPGSATMW